VLVFDSVTVVVTLVVVVFVGCVVLVVLLDDVVVLLVVGSDPGVELEGSAVVRAAAVAVGAAAVEPLAIRWLTALGTDFATCWAAVLAPAAEHAPSTTPSRAPMNSAAANPRLAPLSAKPRRVPTRCRLPDLPCAIGGPFQCQCRGIPVKLGCMSAGALILASPARGGDRRRHHAPVTAGPRHAAPAYAACRAHG
jgi:hypothetical protein